MVTRLNSLSRQNSGAGFSLVEVLVTLFLLAVATLALTSLISLSTRLSVESERQTVAQAVVNERIEYARSLSYEDVGYTDATGDESDGLLVRNETVTRNQQAYVMTTTITLIDDPGNASLPADALEEPNADYKEVVIEATWSTASGNDRAVKVSTVISPGGNIESCTPGSTACPGGEVCPANGVCPNVVEAADCPSEAYFCGGSTSKTLYLTTSSQLHTYENGVFDLVGSYIGLSGGEVMQDLARNSADGVLYGITDDVTNPSAPTNLYSIDRGTGTATLVSALDTTLGHVYSAATVLSDGRIAIGGPDVIKIFPLSGGGGSGSSTPKNPGFSANASFGAYSWINTGSPGAVAASDNSYAAVMTDGDGLNASQYLKMTNFGFSIPSDATVVGIEVAVERRKIDNDGDVYHQAGRLVKAGTISSAADRQITWPITEGVQTLGGPTDTWGETWTPADINNSNMGFALSVFIDDGGGPSAIAFVDHVTMKVYYTTGSSQVVDIAYSGGPVTVSGDIVERNSKLWFVGNTSAGSGDRCYETTLPSGATVELSTTTVGASDTVRGAVCADTACDTIQVFLKSGITKLIDAATCASVGGGTDTGGTWEGITY